MPDYQRIVTEVRGILRSGNLTLTDQMREVSGQFARVCVSAANRLQRCEEYVYQGRRSEAVQLAEAQPPLLDVLAAISFSERSQWDELMAMYTLASGPAVDAGRAAAVNTAFAELQPLQSLLRDHRRLALRQAPTFERLALLRQLFGSDPSNPVWPQQITVLEGVRGRELRPEFDEAVRQNDVDGVVAIWNQLTQVTWINPPIELVDSARASVGRFLQEKARSNLRQISVQFQTAMNARDIVAAQMLRGRWEQELLQAELKVGDPLAKDAVKPLAWLTDMEMLLKKLKEPNLDDADIEYQYFLMDRWKKFLPNNLENAYQERVKQMSQRSVKRERTIIAASVAGCILAALVLIVFLVFVLRR